MTKKIQKSRINICFVFCILVFAPSVYIELQEVAPFLGKGIWVPYTFSSYDKKIKKPTVNICFVICVIVFAPYLYIEL